MKLDFQGRLCRLFRSPIAAIPHPCLLLCQMSHNQGQVQVAPLVTKALLEPGSQARVLCGDCCDQIGSDDISGEVRINSPHASATCLKLNTWLKRKRSDQIMCSTKYRAHSVYKGLFLIYFNCKVKKMESLFSFKEQKELHSTWFKLSSLHPRNCLLQEGTPASRMTLRMLITEHP